MVRILVLLAALSALFGEASAATDKQCDRMLRRYERECAPTPMPSPVPTRSPQPTVSPLDCEPIGGIKTLAGGQNRMFCFDAPLSGGTFVAVESRNHGNVGCASLQAQLTGPDGSTADSIGAQPGAMLARIPGRFYWWVSPLWLSDAPGCDIYTFTVR